MGASVTGNFGSYDGGSDGVIKKCLDLSTGHICRDTADWLTRLTENLRANGGDTCAVQSLTHGWFFWVGAFDSHDGTPDDLISIIQFARRQDCHYVILDADSCIASDLPTYDW